MIKRVLSVALAAVLCVALLGACASTPPEQAIVGSWECRDNSQPHIWMCTLTFDADGRFVDGDGDWGSFILSGNTLTFQFDEFGAISVNYRIRGNRLTLTGDGLNIVLHRR